MMFCFCGLNFNCFCYAEGTGHVLGTNLIDFVLNAHKRSRPAQHWFIASTAQRLVLHYMGGRHMCNLCPGCNYDHGHHVLPHVYAAICHLSGLHVSTDLAEMSCCSISAHVIHQDLQPLRSSAFPGDPFLRCQSPIIINLDLISGCRDSRDETASPSL